MHFSTVAVLTFAALTVQAAMPGHRGALRLRQAGTNFITSPCGSDTDCASGCCGFTSGKCEGNCVALQRQGCGFKNAQPNANAAAASGACSSLVTGFQASVGAPAGGASSGNSNNGSNNGPPPPVDGTAPPAAQGSKFITSTCSADSECGSGCCGFTSGKCEGFCVALQRQGCGFGTATPNANAASASGTCASIVSAFQAANGASNGQAGSNNGGAGQGNAGAGQVNSGPAPPSGNDGQRGTQFITGPCSSNNDCVSGCCVTSKGTCGAVGAQPGGARDCQGGVALPNLNL